MFQTTFVGFILFLCSIPLLLKNVLRKSSAPFILIFLIFNYVFFTFVPNKNIRYLFPLMPTFSIFIAFALEKITIWKNKTGLIISTVLSIYFVITYFILSFGFPVFPKYKYSLDLPLVGWTDIYYLHYYPVRLIYRNSDFPYAKMLQDISKIKQGRVKILPLKDTQDINVGILNPYLYQYPELIARRNDFKYIGYDSLLQIQTEEQIRDYVSKNVDAVIVPIKFLGLKDYIREYDTIEKFRKFFLEGKATDFTIVNTYELAGDEFYPGDTLLLFKKK